MNFSSAKTWKLIALVEAIAIIAILTMRARIVINAVPVSAVSNPLHEALEYDSPDAKFEELVKEYPDWIWYRPNVPGAYNTSILEDCAIARRTNYVRILLANGADAKKAIEILKKHEEADAIKVISDVQLHREGGRPSTNGTRKAD